MVSAAMRTFGHNSPLNVLYLGTGTNRHWCLEIIANTDVPTTDLRFATEDALRKAAEPSLADANVIFLDGLPGGFLDEKGLTFLTMPAWLKQRLQIDGSWASQIRSMRRGTRREVARTLRSGNFHGQITSSASDVDTFYSKLYEPYVRHRHGTSAVVVEPARFARECRRGVILQALYKGDVVGASLLRRTGNSLAIVWTGIRPDAQDAGIRGISDVLDYFSLLYGHLNRCRWLDFGPSRPDAFDGTLRYKKKWQGEVTKGLVPQAPIRLACSGRDEGEIDFLAEHAFIARCGGQLAVTGVAPQPSDTVQLRSLANRLSTPGISRYALVTSASIPEEVGDELRRACPGMSIQKISSAADAFSWLSCH